MVEIGWKTEDEANARLHGLLWHWLPGLAHSQRQAPALASSSAEYFRDRIANSKVPTLLNKAERAYYTDLFRAIESENWTRVEELFEERSDGPLHQVARAEFYTHANSPKVTAEQVAAWFDDGVALPQADQMARLGMKRGLEYVPDLPTGTAAGFAALFLQAHPPSFGPRRHDARHSA